MTVRPTRHAIADGVYFNSIVDTKFMRNRIALHAVLPLTEATASQQAIVPLLLRKGCKSYPDFTTLNEKLYDLYGASLNINVSRFNQYQIISLIITGLDNRLALHGEDIIAESTQLLSELFFEPVLDSDGFFPKKDVALEREYLVNTIQSEINNKIQYAVSQCVREMAKGNPLSLHRYGDIDSARAITPESATRAWERFRDNGRIEIFFTGSGDAQPSLDTFTQAFAGRKRNPIDFSVTPLLPSQREPQEISERLDVQQGNLVIGWRVSGIETLQDKNIARVFSALYGGSTFSKLFVNVREKLSLCYHCSANIDSVNHMMLAVAGIEFANKEKAEKEILHQLELMQQGEFSQKDLEQAKLYLISNMKGAGDSPNSLESWYLGRTLLDESITPQEAIDDLKTITKDDVVRMANALTLDTVYFLQGILEDTGKEDV